MESVCYRFFSTYRNNLNEIRQGLSFNGRLDNKFVNISKGNNVLLLFVQHFENFQFCLTVEILLVIMKLSRLNE